MKRSEENCSEHFYNDFQVEVDITLDENAKLFDLYRYEIPVFFLESKFVCKNRLDCDKLKLALDEWTKKSEEAS